MANPESFRRLASRPVTVSGIEVDRKRGFAEGRVPITGQRTMSDSSMF